MNTEMRNSDRNELLILALAAGTSMSLLFNYLVYLNVYSGLAGREDSSLEMACEDWQKSLIMFGIMLAGMFCNQVFESLRARKTAGKITVNICKLMLHGFRGISFWMAVVVSPVIFYTTYLLAGNIPESKVACFYAFQNGFFWYNIFSRFDSVSGSVSGGAVL